MPNNLPADFDANWYLETYPDVALSGLGPKEHYLRFGRLMGRKPRKNRGSQAHFDRSAAACQSQFEWASSGSESRAATAPA